MLEPMEGGTRLVLDLVAEKPCFRERVYWRVVKPMHALMSWKALRIIKRDVTLSANRR